MVSVITKMSSGVPHTSREVPTESVNDKNVSVNCLFFWFDSVKCYRSAFININIINFFLRLTN